VVGVTARTVTDPTAGATLVTTVQGYGGQPAHAGEAPEKTVLGCQSLTIASSAKKEGCIFYKCLEESRMRMGGKSRVSLGEKSYICS